MKRLEKEHQKKEEMEKLENVNCMRQEHQHLCSSRGCVHSFLVLCRETSLKGSTLSIPGIVLTLRILGEQGLESVTWGLLPLLTP